MSLPSIPPITSILDVTPLIGGSIASVANSCSYAGSASATYARISSSDESPSTGASAGAPPKPTASNAAIIRGSARGSSFNNIFGVPSRPGRFGALSTVMESAASFGSPPRNGHPSSPTRPRILSAPGALCDECRPPPRTTWSRCPRTRAPEYRLGGITERRVRGARGHGGTHVARRRVVELPLVFNSALPRSG